MQLTNGLKDLPLSLALLNAVLTLSNIQTGSADTDRVVVTGACSNVNSSNTTLVVNVPTTITVQPVSSAVICAGTSTALGVTATGTNSTYQWYNDQGIINGATSASQHSYFS
jgi:hypothetical protein